MSIIFVSTTKWASCLININNINLKLMFNKITRQLNKQHLVKVEQVHYAFCCIIQSFRQEQFCFILLPGQNLKDIKMN